LEDVVDWLAARGLAAFKFPERLEIVRELPHTPVGKVDKAAVRSTLMPHRPTS
jgi:2,3-dihydroxybenzoate-AMP ligase